MDDWCYKHYIRWVLVKFGKMLRLMMMELKRMKVLNLYAGIGGNRKLWEDVEVVSVESNPEIAIIYKDFYPKDNLVIGDAHEYLLKHFSEFDFIWSSPPCPTHSRVRIYSKNMKEGLIDPVYPDMKLYEEIILLKHYFKGKYVVENVIGYYEPLIRPQEMDRHYFWANFHISNRDFSTQDIVNIKKDDEVFGFNISKYNLSSDYNHVKVLRNCVNPYLGLHIFNESKIDIQSHLFT